MMFRTHRMFVILLCLVIYMNPDGLFNYFGLNNAFSLQFLMFLVVAILTSMIPDIDNPSSKLGRNIKIVGYVFDHRGFFHSLPALILFTLIVSRFVGIITTFAFSIGYLSHLLLDTLNKHGIYWLYPLKYKLKGFVKTNGFFEKAMFYIMLILILGVLLNFI